MKTVRIMLDFLQGPIWITNATTGKPETGIPAIDEDEELRAIGIEMQDMFNSYYSFDVGDEPCVFDFEQERADKDRMLSLLERLLARLDEVNDGSFVVDDRESERIRAL